MDDSGKIKLLGTLVVALMLLNISLLAYLWFAPHAGGPMRPGDGRAPAGLVIRELKFDEAQQKQFEVLRDEHHSAMVSIGEYEHKLHDSLFKSLSDNNNQKLVDSLIIQIADGEKQKEIITYHHLALVRQMCTPAQQEIFDNMIAKAMAQNHREEGPPPGN